MKYRTQSANVLNEADRFQRILDWQLFCNEQERALWGYNPDVDWVPGDPIYTHPAYVFRSDACSCGDCDDANNLEGYYGNVPRRMIELFDDVESYRYVRCEDCDVSWSGLDPICWSCGKKSEKGSTFSFFSQPVFQVQNISENAFGISVEMQIIHGLQEELGREWQEVMNRHMRAFSIMGDVIQEHFVEPTIRATSVFQEMWSRLRQIDEISSFYVEQDTRIEPAPGNPFEAVEPEIELVPPVVPNLPEWGAYNRPRVELPANWAELRPTVPLPNMPEPRDFSKLQDEVYWRAANPSIQDRRRAP